MATVATTGFSRSIDSYRAGVEAAKMAMRQVEHANQILLFSSIVHDPHLVSRGVRSITKDASIIGGSAFGEITNHAMMTHSVALMAIQSDSIDFMLVAGHGKPDSAINPGEVTGRKALNLVNSGDDIVLGLFLSEMMGNEKNLQGLQKILGADVPFFGGCCSGNRYASIKDSDFVRGYQYVNTNIHNHSVPLLLLLGKARSGFGIAHGWRPYGTIEHIGRSEDNIIYEIGDTSAVEFYERYLGRGSYTAHPLAFEKNGKLLLRAVTGKTEEGGLRFTTPIPKKKEVRITRGSRTDILQSSREAAQEALDQLGDRKAQFGIIVSCISRHTMLGSRVPLEFQAVQEVLGKKTPLIGFYAAGEFSPLGNTSVYHNLTFCLCLVGDEKDTKTISQKPSYDVSSTKKEEPLCVMLMTQNRALVETFQSLLPPSKYGLVCPENQNDLAEQVRLIMPSVVLLESVKSQTLESIHKVDPTVQVILVAQKEHLNLSAEDFNTLQQKHANFFGLGVVNESLLEIKVLINSAAKIHRQMDRFLTMEAELDYTNRSLQRSEDAIEATEKMLNESYKSLENSNKAILKEKEQTEDAYLQLSHAQQQLWGEMQLACKIQSVLLPEKIDIPGYDISAQMIPVEHAGGDYYDIINTEDKHWIAIGDVSGHGVTAGLIMMMMQTSIRLALAHAPEHSPAMIIENINATLTYNIEKISRGKFMTLCILQIQNNGDISFAGLHQDILVYRAASKTVDKIRTSGLWIGLEDNISGILSNSALHLDPDDVMLLYSDGVTEARVKESDLLTNKSKMYGDERLAAMLQTSGLKSSIEIKNEILKSLEKFDVKDDVTLIVLKRYSA